MTCSLDPEIFDDLFQGCAFDAYVDEARLAKATPCPTKTRTRAYRYYEEALAAKNGRLLVAS